MKSTALRFRRRPLRGEGEQVRAKFQPDLEDLLQQAQGGNERAREELCTAVFDAAKRYARARGLPPVYELNDFAQDVVIELVEQLGVIHRLRFWLPPVLLGRRAFAYRRYYRHVISRLDEAQSQIEAGSEQRSAEEHSRHAAHLDVMMLASKLPDSQKAIMIMHCVDGMPFQDICEVSGMKPSSVRMQFLRAKQRLKKHLNIRNGEGLNHGNIP